MLLNCGVGEDSWESLGLQGDPTNPPQRKSVLNIHWKDWCWSWSSNPLATWCKELTRWKRPWCWERLKAGGEGDDRGRDDWMASLTRWTWFEQALGVDDGQGSLACSRPWDHKELDTGEWLNNNKNRGINKNRKCKQEMGRGSNEGLIIFKKWSISVGWWKVLEIESSDGCTTQLCDCN